MEKRRPISRVLSHRFRPVAATTTTTTICPSSPSSGGDSPTNPTSTHVSTSPRRRRKPFSQTPTKVLRKQRSAESLNIRGGLWPSAKNLPDAPNTGVIAATLLDHLINDCKNEEEEDEEAAENGRPMVGVATHAASTFSSRQRAAGTDSPAFEISSSNPRKGRRSRSTLSSLKSINKKQPGTPPSPSSSSSSSSFSGPNAPSASRLPQDSKNKHARRRSEVGIDFPSTESDGKDTRNSRSRAPVKIAGKLIRKSGSPVRRSKSPVMRNSRSPPVPYNSRSPVLRRQNSPPAKGIIGGGMGNIISMGLGSLFRRKSFSGAGVTTKSSLVGKEADVNGLSGRKGMAEGVGSPTRGGVPATVELQHKLRMAHNQLMQWRFLNGRMTAVSANKWTTAQNALLGGWIGLSELQTAVTRKRLQLANHKLSLKLHTLISPQMKAVERWGSLEKHHLAAISSTKDCLHAVVCRLPLTDRAKADPQILAILLRKVTNLMSAINGNVAACNTMAQQTVPLVTELAGVVSKEKPLIEECFELLELFSKLQFREESLRCHLIQLKS
ncbi:AUGMIN subunit 8-like [Phalaenopsis equestris]|uniref:AUGMIN subunit 8-like n=1 Tax=Phalaenopsis equestris TaxID=78828 RepID=UPI0009E510D2|nr:AUGMIN subunit 8-like [Phalaenopsis equestris]